MMLREKTMKRRANAQDRKDAAYLVEMGSFHMTMAMGDVQGRGGGVKRKGEAQVIWG